LDAPAALAQCTFITNADNSLAITGYTGSAGALTIPSTIDGLPVTTIGNSAFNFDSSLTSITIPDSVTSIGNDVFQYCYHLTNVTIGAAVASIGDGAFDGSGSLAAINVNAGNPTFTSVAGVLFDKGQTTLIIYPEGKLGNYTIPSSVTRVGDSAFNGCYNLYNVTIPTNVLSIGEQAFFNCTSLDPVMIPESVTNIGAGAFAGCSSLLNLVVASGNLFYSSADSVLTDKSLTTLLAFPGGLNGQYIARLGGLMGPGLYSIPNSIISIGDYAFYDSKLTNVVIPDNVANIGDYAFYYSPGLTNLIIPNSVTNIGSNAFFFCFGLNNVTLGSGVISIGDNAFYNCASLTNVTMTNSVISIGDDAFSECTYLTNLIIPDSVTSIGDSAFSDCPSLTSITIPNSVTAIGDGAFLGCSLAAFNVGAGNPAYSSVAGVLFNKSLTTLVEYPENRIGRAYKVPSGVIFIGDNAFNGCTILANVTIPDGVATIGDYAFSDSSVTNVTMPNTITSIGDYAFFNSPLFSVKIPVGVASIGDDAFSATPLSVVTIPDTVTNIGEDAFDGSGGLEAINVNSNNPTYTSVAGVLFDKGQTTLIKYPPGRVATSYAIPSGVAVIYDDAFSYCSGLTEVTIPDSVTNIGEGAFLDAGVTSAYFQGNVPTADTSVFSGDTNATAYYYSGASGWGSTFAGIAAVMLNSPVPTGSLQVTIAPTVAVNAGAQWQVDNGISQNSGATVTTLAAGAHTVSFTPISGWITPAEQTVTITNQATTKTTGIYKQVPKGNPTLTFTSPKSGQSVTGGNSMFTVTGKTTDKLAVTNVSYQFNGGSWTSATPSNSWSNWTASVTLNPGPNTFSAYAQDISGAVSATVKVNFKFFLSDPLVVVVPVNEDGKVTPDDNGKMLGLGTNFTLTAVPGKNWIFSNWVAGGSESFVSNNPVLKFTMQSNLVLTANFVTNLFLAAQGGYHGLFSVTNAPREQTNSGGFSFNLTSSGAFTGTLLLGPDKPLNLDGAFDVAGEAEVLLKPTAKMSLTVNMQLDFTSQTVSGTVSDGSFVAQLDGYRNVFSSPNPAKGYEGQYTLIILGTNDPTVGPYGVSYGTVSVSSAGIVTFGGSLADGTTGLSQSSAISQNGYWPLYVQLYGGAGSLWAWNCLSNNKITGTASWINETNSSKTAVYRSGFTNQGAKLTGGAYVPSNSLPGDFTVTLDGGDLPFIITNGVTVTSSDKVVTNSADDTNKLTLAINKNTGVISGGFANPSNPKETIKVNGVILQRQTNAQGYFLGTNQSGLFLLEYP
jgi:hypothetical protein